MGYIYVVELYEDKWYIYFTTDDDFQYWECDENISEFLYHYQRLKLILLYLIVINMIQINM